MVGRLTMLESSDFGAVDLQHLHENQHEPNFDCLTIFVDFESELGHLDYQLDSLAHLIWVQVYLHCPFILKYFKQPNFYDFMS